MAIDNSNTTTPESEKDLAQTPNWFIRSLEKYMGTEISMDVCALPSTAKHEIYYSLEDDNDALKCNWSADYKEVMDDDFAHPTAWCNPPFSDPITWINKILEQVDLGVDTYLLLPNNPETAYVRKAKRYAETIIEMPFRLKFLRPDGSKFLDDNGREKTPKFSCLVAVMNRRGLTSPTHHTYHDFREGFYAKGKEL